VHGADAVLFFDNASTAYDTAALHEAVAGVAGMAVAAVMPWPFKYGPQGLDHKRYWDSDFCQLGAWEDIRWRFLAQARSAMNSDIDETGADPQSCRRLCRQRALAVRHRQLSWPLGAGHRDGSRPQGNGSAERHRDFAITLRRKIGPGRFLLPMDLNRCRPKWTVVPARCPPASQWTVHSIARWPVSRLPSPGISFRHFRPISTSWKYARVAAASFDPALYERDEPLATAMARVDWDR